MKFPFDELSTHNREHVDWVKSQRDPELWHVFATALVVSGDPHGFLVWLFDQPETDRATAGLSSSAFLVANIWADAPNSAARD